MNDQDREVIKEVVAEAVHEEIPLAVGEALTPLITTTVKGLIRRYVWQTRIGYVIAAAAVAVTYVSVKDQADQNTDANHRQDCILAGLIRGVGQGDKDPVRSAVYETALHELEKEGSCPELAPPKKEGNRESTGPSGGSRSSPRGERPDRRFQRRR